MGRNKQKQLKFEDYLSFFGNRRADNLTTSQLNQVLFLPPSFFPPFLLSSWDQLFTIYHI
jgi:hypothetical protein